MAVAFKANTGQLLNYIQAGKEAFQKVKKSMSRVNNAGRTEARRRISADFGVRTGFLRRQARKMQTKVTVRASEIKGEVKPIPRLMNIFEGGATLAQGRGTLRPRPVVAPGRVAMQDKAETEFNQILKEVGK